MLRCIKTRSVKKRRMWNEEFRKKSISLSDAAADDRDFRRVPVLPGAERTLDFIYKVGWNQCTGVCSL